jgi:hypothetical protein
MKEALQLEQQSCAQAAPKSGYDTRHKTYEASEKAKARREAYRARIAAFKAGCKQRALSFVRPRIRINLLRSRYELNLRLWVESRKELSSKRNSFFLTPEKIRQHNARLMAREVKDHLTPEETFYGAPRPPQSQWPTFARRLKELKQAAPPRPKEPFSAGVTFDPWEVERVPVSPSRNDIARAEAHGKLHEAWLGELRFATLYMGGVA